jgi:hypothetical protein
MWFDPGLARLFITLTLLHLGLDINLLIVSIVIVFSTKNPHLPLVWGVIHVKVSFRKKDFIRLKLGFARNIYFKNSEGNKQTWCFLISSKVN